MAQKPKKLNEIISLQGEARKVVSYADYFARRPLFSSLQIKNSGENVVNDLTLSVYNANGLLINSTKVLEEIPYESVVEVELGSLLSPVYFADLETVREETIEVKLQKEKTVLASFTHKVTALPFDYWQGFEGDPEQIAAFVRPRLADCSRLHTEVAAQLKKWGCACDLGGYVGNDKNAVRKIIAALYAALRHLNLQKTPVDITVPVKAGAGVKLLSVKEATTLEMSLFV